MIPLAYEGLALNQLAVPNMNRQLPLAYRPTESSAGCIPIPIFTRYSSKDAGCEENFMTPGQYIAWDEETAQEDVQMWRLAVQHVLKNSTELQRRCGKVFGAVTNPSLNTYQLDFTNTDWVLVKILSDVGLSLANRISNSDGNLDPFDTLPSMLRSITLTIAGILQSGDRPIGTAWSCCKNVLTRPEVPEDLVPP